MKKIVLSLLFAGCLLPCFAQNRKAANPRAIIVAGKVLSPADSALVKQLFFDGLHQKMVQNYQLAGEYFNRIIELDPANDGAMYELAMIYHSRNREAEAEKLLRNAVTVQPDNKWYWISLADVYKKTSNMLSLVPVFDELIRLEPGNEDYYFDKANAFLIQNKVKEAEEVYNEIEKRYGLSDDLAAARQRVFVQQGKPEKAAAAMEKQAEAKPSDLRNLLNLAEVYNKSGEIDKAVGVLKKAAVMEPGNALIRLALADNYRALKKFDDAFVELKLAFADINMGIDEKVRIILSFFPQFADPKARAYAGELARISTQVHPEEAKAFAVYGDVLFQEQKNKEAKEAYRKALKLNNQVYQIWEQLIRIDIMDSSFSEAVSDGEAALSIFPNQAALYLFTGMAYGQMQNHAKAVSYLKNAAILETEDKEVISQIYSSLGDSYNAMKRYAESNQAYEKSLELSPDNSYTLNNYAYYLSLRGEDLQKAEKMSKRSLVLDPDNPSSEDTYAWILFKLKKYQEALVWIEKALKNSKEESAVQIEHYGDILFHTGNKQQAVQQWQKAKAAGAKSVKLEQKINEKKYIE